jgi:hypothetical protein
MAEVREVGKVLWKIGGAISLWPLTEQWNKLVPEVGSIGLPVSMTFFSHYAML